jgi:nucleotide-binding universal stress UspA family protein
MYRNILVPTDLTDRTVAALEAAGGIGRQENARVTLLHVIETVAGTDFAELSSFYRVLERRAGDRLKAFVAQTAGRAPEPAVEIVYGSRVEEVLRFVRENGVDLVVLASHPVDASQPSGGLGTMSYRLGALAPCSVLLVK